MQSRNIDRLTADLNHSFYLYRREVESIPLLDKEGELAIHQAIEAHLKELLWICTAVPASLEAVHAHFEKINHGELRLETLLHGFASIDPLHPKPDLLEVQQRLFKLSILQYHTQAKLENLGSEAPETQACRQQLLEALASFKWTALIIDKLAEYFQSLGDKFYYLKQKFQQAFNALKQAKQDLINSNLRLVFFMAKKYTYLGVQFLDLLQEGNIGLIQAVERFDYHWGYAFSTYASICIKHAILKSIPKFKCLSIEEEMSEIEDQETPNPFDIALSLDLSKRTQQVLSSLTPREADILRLRFGIGTPDANSLGEIAEIFKISRERIRQIEAKALKALRDQIKMPSLRVFLNKD